MPEKKNLMLSSITGINLEQPEIQKRYYFELSGNTYLDLAKNFAIETVCCQKNLRHLTITDIIVWHHKIHIPYTGHSYFGP